MKHSLAAALRNTSTLDALVARLHHTRWTSANAGERPDTGMDSVDFIGIGHHLVTAYLPPIAPSEACPSSRTSPGDNVAAEPAQA